MHIWSQIYLWSYVPVRVLIQRTVIYRIMDCLYCEYSSSFQQRRQTPGRKLRPVSLTSIICKLMEHIMHSQVMDHLDEHSILCDNQHGFRSKRSCETQLIITIEEITRKLVTGEQVDIILLDVSKAFDKVPHRRLLHRLRYYIIRNNTFLWIQDFLSHRTQEVQLEGRKSTTADMLSGVPRGTVLGPLLFLLFINDLPESTESNARLFADDCLLFRPIRNNRDRQILQNDLNSLEEWENRWQMVFHPEKCVVIRVSNRRKPINAQHTIHGHIYLANILELPSVKTYDGMITSTGITTTDILVAWHRWSNNYSWSLCRLEE